MPPLRSRTPDFWAPLDWFRRPGPLLAVVLGAAAVALVTWQRGHLSNAQQLELAVFLFASLCVSAVAWWSGRGRDQKKAEAALRESEAGLPDFVDDAPVVLWLSRPDGRYVYRSRRWYDYTGQPEEAALGAGWIEAVHPDDRGRVARTIQDAVERGEAFQLEYRLRERKGAYRWFLDAAEPRRGRDGKLLGHIGSVVDITERYEAEESLRKSEERLRLAQTATELGIWDWDLVADTSECSPEWFRLNGLPNTEERTMQRGQFFELIHPDDREHVAKALTRALEPGQPFFEYRVVWPDESVHWLASRARVFRDDAGRPLRVLGITFEVTARKQIAEQLHQVQRAESVKRLAGGVAHEVNNQMTVVLGLCDFLLGRSDLVEAARSDLAEVRRAAERSSRIAVQMLAFSRQQVLKRDVADLNELIRREEPLLRRVLDHSVRLSLVLDPVPVHANVDPVQFAQVLLNLVMNARDAMPCGGTLAIETKLVELDAAMVRQIGLPETTLGRDAPPERGRYACVSVADTGKGMSTATIARVFEPFFTTKKVGEGTGLGLPTAYGIVRQHDGHIAAESELGRGSTFRVYLPIAEPSASAATRERDRGERGNATVLVVDDDLAVRGVVTRALELEGFETLSASNGREALRVLAHHEGAIDLVVTDIVMPEMDGRELMKILCGRRPDLPIIAMSGYTDATSLGPRVLENGVECLTKPFAPRELVAKVRDALASARARRE